MGGGSKPAPAPQIIQRVNPYDDSWIHNKFATGQQQATELANFMNQRKAALATPTMYNIGGGVQVAQKDFGQYVQGQLNKQQQSFTTQLQQLQANAGANRQSMLAQGTAPASANPAVTGVQSPKRKNLGTYSGTGGGFNRSELRIQNLNV